MEGVRRTKRGTPGACDQLTQGPEAWVWGAATRLRSRLRQAQLAPGKWTRK